MKNAMTFRVFVCRRFFVLVALVCVSSLCYVVAQEQPDREPGAFERVIARTVASRLGDLHYAQRELDDELSERVFREYFELLDPQHVYFLASDVQSFAHQKRQLDDQLGMGRVHFPYEVYDLYLERLADRIEFVEKTVGKGFDLSREETFDPDRADADWPANSDERNDLWRRRLKNLYLTYGLMDQGEYENGNDQDKNDADEDQDAGDGDGGEGEVENDAGEEEEEEEARADSGVLRKTPEQRVLDYHTRQQRFMTGKTTLEVLELYLSALARAYDPHSAYMGPRAEEDFDIHMKLSLQGIGALLSTEDGYVKIVDIIPGGPAERDGRLKPGDRIIEVAQAEEDPVDVINMPLRKVVDMIRGPKGTEVALTVIEAAKGLGGVPVRIDIVRDEVRLQEQEAKAEPIYLDGCGNRVGAADETSDAPAGEVDSDARILLVSLPSFYRDFEGEQNGDKEFKSSTRDVKKLLEPEIAKGLDGLILDLRGNGGGSLQEAVELAGLFFPKGPVVQARYSDGRVKVLRDRDGQSTFSGPLVVLVDRLSASASEIVAAALQDSGRACVVGADSTHGKGTIQTLYHLDREFQRLPAPFNEREPGTVKLTVGKFYRISGGATQLKGVQPDITFEAFADYMELGEANLDNPMPWDSIDPVHHPQRDIVGPYLKTLAERAEARKSRSAEYADLRERISRFAELRRQTEVPLNKSARINYHDRQEAVSDAISSVRGRRDGEEAENDGQNADEDEGTGDSETLWRPDDYVLKEACRVLSDLIRLTAGDGLCPVGDQLAESATNHAPADPHAN